MTRIGGLQSLGTSRSPQRGSRGAIAPNGKKPTTGGIDEISPTGRGRLVAVVAPAVRDCSDVRQAKVLALKAAIANGTYDASPREVAERLLASDEFAD